MSPVPPINVPPPLPAALVPLHGTDWNRVTPVRSTDGDTVRILRSQLTWELVSTVEIGDHSRLTYWTLRVVEDDPEELAGGIAARLVNLDTPERGQPGYKDASLQLWAWILAHGDELRCITYDGGGSFDRILVDLYVLAPDGRTVEDSASQFMLRQGWLPYIRGV